MTEHGSQAPRDSHSSTDRRIWALYRLQWTVRRIAGETGQPLDEVQDTVTRVRQDPAYAHQLEHDPPPPGWEMFPPPATGSRLPAVIDPPWPGRYAARHARRRRVRPLWLAVAAMAAAAGAVTIAMIFL